MAELKKGLFNGSSGRIGNLISYERNGKYFVRTRPVKVKQPNTEKQLQARMRFSLLQPINALLKEILRYGFATDEKARPAYSAALSWNLKHAISGTYPDLEVNYEQLRIFNGSRALPTDIRLDNKGNELQIQWTCNTEGQAYAKDRAALILFSLENNFSELRLEAAKRTEERLSYHNDRIKGPVHVYISFYKEIPIKGQISEKEVCPSYYCGLWEPLE